MHAIGDRVRAARSLLGWPQDRLADAAGIPVSALRRLETRDVAVGDAERRRLAAVRAALSAEGIQFIERGGLAEGPGLTFARERRDLLDDSQAIARLRQACDAAGSARAFAAGLGIAASNVFAALGGRRRMTGRMAEAIGLRAIRHLDYVASDRPAAPLSPPEARARLRQAVEEAGSQVAFARAAGVTKAAVSNQLAGRHPIDGKVARALGLTPVRTHLYRRIPEDAADRD
jgi:transcriptional regulator with XRE-family HTH domain